MKKIVIVIVVLLLILSVYIYVSSRGDNTVVPTNTETQVDYDNYNNDIDLNDSELGREAANALKQLEELDKKCGPGMLAALDTQKGTGIICVPIQ